MNSSRPESDPFDLPFDPNVGPGNFPWDHWERNAREAAVIEDLVQLGRSLMREAVQHGWSDELRTECGWSDDGAAMIQLAISAPEQAEQRWRYLLYSDGGRVPGDG